MRITEAGRDIIRDLYREHGDSLAPRKMVDHATDPASPLHGLFNWDNASAADAHRLDQARSIMRRVIIVSVPTLPVELNVAVTNAPPPTPAFVVPDPRSGHGGYVAIQSVASDPDLRAMMLNQYRKELNGLLGRFRNFQSVLASQGATGCDVTAFNDAITLMEQAIAAMPQSPASEEAA